MEGKPHESPLEQSAPFAPRSTGYDFPSRGNGVDCAAPHAPYSRMELVIGGWFVDLAQLFSVAWLAVAFALVVDRAAAGGDGGHVFYP